MDEFSAVWRARELLGAACVSSIPVDVTLYVNRVGGMVRLLDLPLTSPVTRPKSLADSASSLTKTT